MKSAADTIAITNGKTYRKLIRLMILLRQFETEAKRFIDQGHGRRCRCRYCRLDNYGDVAAEDLKGVLWGIRSLLNVWESELLIGDLVDVKVEVTGRVETLAEWSRRNRRALEELAVREVTSAPGTDLADRSRRLSYAARGRGHP